mgnify:CR=1 FL=1
MEIDERLQGRLEGLLRTELPKIRLREEIRSLDISDLFVLDEKFSSLIQKTSKETREEFESYIGERSFLPVVAGFLYDEALKIPAEEKAGKKFLCECSPFNDVEKLAKKIVGMFLALPLEYLIAIKLPNDLADILRENKSEGIFGRRLAVVGNWHQDRQDYPAPQEKIVAEQENRLLQLSLNLKKTGAPVEQVNSANSAYLFLRVAGYIDDDAVFSRQPLSKSITLLKAFLGLAIGMNILNVAGPLATKSTPVQLDIYGRRDGVWGKLTDEELNHGASQLAHRMTVGQRDSSAINLGLKSIVSVLDREADLPQLVLAGRWFFDSRANADEVMGFMQLAICAETLLGTEDGADGVTGILASRCAYLIAESMKERDDLFVEFKSLYKVRSKIVHRGLGVFRKSERQQYLRLRAICSRIIQKEVTLAMADESENQEAPSLIQALHSAQALVADRSPSSKNAAAG